MTNSKTAFEGWSNYATAMVARHFDNKIDRMDNPTADELARLVDYHIEDLGGEDPFIYSIMQENLERIDYDELEEHFCDPDEWEWRQRMAAEEDRADQLVSERGMYDD